MHHFVKPLDVSSLLGRLFLTLVTLLLAISARAMDRFGVTATFTVIADLLANVGCDHLTVSTIVGPNSDC